MKKSRIRWLTTLIAAAMFSAFTTAQAVSVSNLPLFISTAASPNIMLLIDNSGSMDNAVWAAGFNTHTTYADWSPSICGQNDDQECWTTDSTIFFTDIERGSGTGRCSSGWKQGRNSGNIKCLKLSDPAGSGNTRYLGNYLNYLFATYADGTDLTGGQIPTTTRLQSAKNVATAFVTNNSNLRIGITSFNAPPASGTDQARGGKVNAVCGSSTSTLTTTISGLSAETWTPLAETFYEITRYFRGLTSHFNSNVTYTSPIQYRCQKNFVIVVTDGFPTYDNDIPTDDVTDVADTAHSLPNWDGLAPSTTQSQYPDFPQYSDGFKGQSSTGQSDEGYTLYLDDLAKFGFDIDLMSSGTDAAGMGFNDPPFVKQNLITYTVGFSVANQMLQDAATYGDGQYFTAQDEDQLTAALQSAVSDILARTSSASSVATNSTRLSTNTFIYQARFSSADWSGQLLAYQIQANGNLGTFSWDASTLIPAPASRSIFTYDPTAAAGSRGKTFMWGQLNSAQQTALNKNAAGTNDGHGQDRLNYVRGNRSDEAPSAVDFRARSTVLGDIINSDPYYVGKQDYGYSALPGTEGSSYISFRTSNAYQSRPPMLYVGANDGMLHGFDASTGVERMAYVPAPVINKLSLLTAANYNASHRYLVDGAPRAVDAYLSSTWKTILLGSLGAGGNGIFALDVTDPTSFSTSKVLWEFTDSNDSDLGVSIPQPTIARMNNGDWAAIVANGYNSSSQNAILFILNLTTGAILAKIDTKVGSDNGLSSPIPVDVDRDRIVDYIYAGDLKGNLWKFDVTGSNANTWKSAFGTAANPAPLYTACSSSPCTTSNRQPITARPEVGANPKGGQMVYFGTGRYFAVGDNNAVGTQPTMTYYGIQDRNDKSTNNPQPTGSARTILQQQQVVGTTTVSGTGFSEFVRVTTHNTVSDSQYGWYLDLPENGERSVSNSQLRGGKIVFTTLTPAADPCGGGTSWLMELDALTGSRLDFTPFDINHDNRFDSQDYAAAGTQTTPVPVSGRRSKEGIIKTPGVITDPVLNLERKYASGTSGGIDITIENSRNATGRQSWRQL